MMDFHLLASNAAPKHKRNENPCLQIPYFPQRPLICPASCLEVYIKRTAELRLESQEFLFLATRPPYKPASTATISRWIKNILTRAGIDTKIFSAYSTRYAAISAAYQNGISLETIRKTAGWTERSQMFAKHYNLPIRDTQCSAKALITRN